ncbi:hypothetical protein [Streptomyces sp. NPDC058228]
MREAVGNIACDVRGAERNKSTVQPPLGLAVVALPASRMRESVRS